MAAVISFTVPNQPAAYPMGGTVSPFAGYNFAVLQDGTITIVASGGIAGVAWLGFSGAPVGFTVLAGANGELTLSGQASAIVGALQQGAITLTGGLAPNFYGFSVPSAWIQTNFTETPAVFSNSVATFTDPGLLSSSLDFFQFGQQVDLQPGNWQLTFSYALTDGASHGTYGLPYLSIGWFKDSVGNNVDTNAQLPQFMVTSLSSGTAQLTFTLTSEVKDFLTFEGGNANVTIGSPLLGVLPPVSLSISGPGTFVSGTTATTTSSISDTGTPACFAAGTRIQTAGGDVAVEALRAGDLVATVLGGLRPVIWVGHTRIDLDRHPRAEELAPIRVAADAFGPGRPRRDLLLSPDHALHVDGALIPVHLLVNGATIAREPARGRVTYFHVELESHDILLAEGLAAESYLDTGNRASFANGGPMRTLHADPSLGAAALAVWAAAGCAPLRLEGPAVL
ncbi:MAG: Hint domain-containing protein, partial [Rhodospirillales bacterium]|nr:Hint domain-containing protein [Rhodospirillales bacterium]